MKSIIKHLPISILNHCLYHGFRGFNKQTVDYLLNKYKKYVMYLLSSKKFKYNSFHIDKPGFMYLNLEYILTCLFKRKFGSKTLETYEYILEQFSQLENDLSEINVKSDMIVTYNKLISSLQYNNKIATALLRCSLEYKQDKNMSFTKQLIFDGGDPDYMHEEIIYVIINNQNLDLLDLMHDKKIIRQCDLDFILINSYKNKLAFVEELINYGADIDSCHKQLLELVIKHKNVELVNFLENYYNEE
ncbi:hypothetical protein QJ854_gp920 [Moumouvirus goulette]|uniref:Repeat protein n=1 Tax=Moumouvirus goulette TaxID=1247379 RepID=M1PVV8_9VIRU|nr:hypothetical protein QJ854_gp920 [Moumouvirus goulette]AGF84862.1 hypothetical protein glt_00053 [Moumouvirus goulette]